MLWKRKADGGKADKAQNEKQILENVSFLLEDLEPPLADIVKKKSAPSAGQGPKPLLSMPAEVAGKRASERSFWDEWSERLAAKVLGFVGRWLGTDDSRTLEVASEGELPDVRPLTITVTEARGGWLKARNFSPLRKRPLTQRVAREAKRLTRHRSPELVKVSKNLSEKLHQYYAEQEAVSKSATLAIPDEKAKLAPAQPESKRGALAQKSPVKSAENKKKAKTAKKTTLPPSEKQYKPFENALSLVTFIEYSMRNRQVGAYLLKHNNEYRFTFGFECAGLHQTLSDAELKGIINRLDGGLKDAPANEFLTFHYRSFRTGKDRYDYLKLLLSKANSKILQLIIMYELARTKELVDKGIRKPKELYLYATYTVTSEVEESNSWYEKFLAQLFQGYELMTGDKQIREKKFENFVRQGFLEGYLKWENFFLSTLGLTIRPLRSEELWKLAWSRLNAGKCNVSIPQYVYVSDVEIREVIRSQVHPSTLLVAESEPVADERWVKVGGNYIGVLNMLEKPGGWENCRAQLRYLWEIIAKERVYDIEIFSEVSRANANLVRESMRRVMKQSLTSQNIAMQESSIDVVAQIKAGEAVEAQAQMFSGAVPFWVGFTILVHRKTLEELDEACRYLESCFLRPAWVQREKFLSWRIWLQTLPMSWEGILTKPYMRRLLMLNHEIIGLIPWIMPVVVDRAGLELVTEEGGAPIWINLTASAEPKHLGIFATTRAGKSVLVSGILTSALVAGMPVNVVDFPKPDGTSTFTDFTKNLGGAYFDISKESNNLFQIPDLSHHKPEDIPVFFADYVSFLEASMMTMILGKGEGVSSVLKNNIRAIVTLALNEFFQDEEILERYDLAFYHGQGSEYWNQMPTLADFLSFCQPERLKFEMTSVGLDEAFQVTNLRLRQWLVSRVGKAVASPTSFNVDSRLIVFALRNIQNEEDAAVLALSALGSAMRSALSSPASIFFIDEAPILFEFPAISDLIGRLCANGAKAGIRVILSAQDPKTVVEASSGSKICDNLAVRLIGRIQPTAVPSFQKYLYYPLEIISRNATKSFFPNKNEIYSQWLLDYQGSYTYCRYYPGLLQLALVANNPDEQKLRDSIMLSEPDPIKAMVKMTKALEAKLRS